MDHFRTFIQFVRILLPVIVVMAFSISLTGQVVNEPDRNIGIYQYLDEMANLGVISLQSAVKPYSRAYIAGKLVEIRNSQVILPEGSDSGIVEIRNGKMPKLNSRQVKELNFYLQDYQADLALGLYGSNSSGGYRYGTTLAGKGGNKLIAALNPAGLHYRDSLFTLSIRPILGIKYQVNGNGNAWHRWWGASMYGYVGRHFAFYTAISDNNQSEPFAKPEYFTTEPGSVYKYRDDGSADFTEIRGGITASVDWGSVGLVYDRLTWGDGYHSANILSGKAPAFPSIQLRLNPVRWFGFNYIHGWLNSNVIDSSRSYWSGDDYRIVYRNKFLAANMFTFYPWRGLGISFGNSIIYSDVNVNPLYLIPFMFFNAADAVKNNYNNDAGSNSQLFFNISSRQIRHLHLYFSFFVDEWKTSRLLDPDKHNFTNLKGGVKVSNLFKSNLSLVAEYTRTQPMTYLHYLPATTFASNDFTLGHYMRENSQEIFLQAQWQPLRGVLVELSWTLAMHGDDVPYDYHAGYQVDEVPFMQNKTWQDGSVGLTARYEFASGGYFFLGYRYGDQWGNDRFTMPVMQGRTGTFSSGISLGF